MQKAFFLIMALLSLSVSSSANAKLKYIQKPNTDYDFKKVEKIVILPITSENVDFGKVDEERMPKVSAILEKTKKNMRDSIIKGYKNAKTSIPFYANQPDKKATTLLLKFNITQFDNGNQVARLVPFAGKAKVTVNGQFLRGDSKVVLADLTSSVKAKGGMVAGGMDSEVLWSASNMAFGEILRQLNKLTGLDYSLFSGIAKGIDDGVKGQADVMKEEKSEKEILKKKTVKSK